MNHTLLCIGVIAASGSVLAACSGSSGGGPSDGGQGDGSGTTVRDAGAVQSMADSSSGSSGGTGDGGSGSDGGGAIPDPPTCPDTPNIVEIDGFAPPNNAVTMIPITVMAGDVVATSATGNSPVGLSNFDYTGYDEAGAMFNLNTHIPDGAQVGQNISLASGSGQITYQTTDGALDFCAVQDGILRVDSIQTYVGGNGVMQFKGGWAVQCGGSPSAPADTISGCINMNPPDGG